MKCQKCQQHPATLHITEVLDEENDSYEELHLCEQCAQKYLFEAQKDSDKSPMPMIGDPEDVMFNQHQCPDCGMKFVDFRNTGRLGCPNDYQEFRQELVTLLENIHGETRHCGKSPSKTPLSKQTQSELIQLRNRLKQAVTKEDYEDAARIRDQIRKLEKA